MTTLRLPSVLRGAGGAEAVRDALRAVPEGGAVVLDLRDVAEIDMPALGALAGGAREVRARGGSVEVRDLSPHARRVLNATGLLRCLPSAFVP